MAASVAPPDVPWGLWSGVRQALPFPLHLRAIVLAMRGGSPLGPSHLGAALDAPIGAPRLETLVTPGTRIAIAVDDATRPTQTIPILDALVARLIAAGAVPRAITIVIAGGAHVAPSAADIDRKVGALAGAGVTIACHHPGAEVAATDATLGGTPVRLNRAFMDADLRIGVGGVLPHPFAGFSGGAKIVLPGLGDLDVLARSHKYALMGFRGGLGFEGNRFRADMEAAVRTVGLHWTVNVVVNSDGDTVHVAAGDMVEAHRAAVRRAREVYATDPPDEPLDAVVLNAFPKDSELLQVETAFVSWRSGMQTWATDRAPVILTAACPRGLGHHGLFGPGGRLFREPSRRSYLGDRALALVVPGLPTESVRQVFGPDYPHYTSWDAACAAVLHPLAPGARVGVVPCAPIQLAAPAQPASAGA